MYDNTILKNLVTEYDIDYSAVQNEIGLEHPLSYYDNAPPSVDELIKIADYFEVSVDLILGRCSEKQKKTMLDSLKFESQYPYNLFEKINGAPIGWIITEDNLKGLEEVMSHLTDRDAGILNLYFEKRLTLEAIGKEFGITKQCVLQKINKAIKILRYPAYKNLILKGFHTIDEVKNYASDVVAELNNREKELEEKNVMLETLILKLSEQFNIPVQEIKEQLSSGKSEEKEFVSIDCLNFPVRLYNCLTKAGLYSIEDITKSLAENPDEFKNIRGLGKKHFLELLKALDNYYGTTLYTKKYYLDNLNGKANVEK